MQLCMAGTTKPPRSAGGTRTFAYRAARQVRYCRAPSCNDPGGRGVASLRRPYEECSRPCAEDAQNGPSYGATPAARSIWRAPRRHLGDQARRCAQVRRRPERALQHAGQRRYAGLGIARLFPLPLHLRRSGAWPDRRGVLSGQLATDITAEGIEQRRCHAAAGIARPRRPIGAPFRCHGALRAGPRLAQQ